MNGKSRLLVYLWSSVGGIASSHAYLGHEWCALLGAFGLCMSLILAAEANLGRRDAITAVVVYHAWIGVHCWGFLHYGLPLHAATVVYQALAGLLVGWVSVDRQGATRGLRLAAGMALVEWLRQLGPIGFPLSLGATQVAMPWRPVLGLLGSYGTTALLVGTMWLIARALLARRASLALVGLLLGTVATLWGSFQPGLEIGTQPLRVAILQGSIPTWLHQQAQASDSARWIVDEQYFSMSESALEDENLDLLILPESALHKTIGQTGSSL
ncbi:MAG: hypothetical protein KC561_13705, partial [Myxococcales bacterium]|nr:hypothetical protein [Myxococcales bacterium]